MRWQLCAAAVVVDRKQNCKLSEQQKKSREEIEEELNSSKRRGQNNAGPLCVINYRLIEFSAFSSLLVCQQKTPTTNHRLIRFACKHFWMSWENFTSSPSRLWLRLGWIIQVCEIYCTENLSLFFFSREKSSKTEQATHKGRRERVSVWLFSLSSAQPLPRKFHLRKNI